MQIRKPPRWDGYGEQGEAEGGEEGCYAGLNFGFGNLREVGADEVGEEGDAHAEEEEVGELAGGDGEDYEAWVGAPGGGRLLAGRSWGGHFDDSILMSAGMSVRRCWSRCCRGRCPGAV